MGYESRLFITNVHRRKETNESSAWIYAEKIADIRMSCMENSFVCLFNKDIDYKLFIDNDEEDTDTDKYGKHMKSASIPEIMTWLEEAMKRDNYRRLAPLYGLLSGFNLGQWDCLEVVHYGY